MGGSQEVSVAVAQKRRKMAIAALCAVLATGAFVGALTLNKAPVGLSAAPVAPGGAKVLVAAVPLSPGAKVTSDEVRLVAYPLSAVTPDNLTSVKQAVGKFVSVRLNPGAVVLSSELEVSDASAVARSLKAGDVAISIPFDEVKGVGGFVQAEDRIDIICDPGNGRVLTCFHNVRVLRSGSLSQVQTPAAPAAAAPPPLPGAAPTPTPDMRPAPVAGALVLVVELSHADAELVSGLLLGKSGSIVRYALLNPVDASPSPSA